MRDTTVITMSADQIRDTISGFLQRYGIPSELLIFLGGAFLMIMFLLFIALLLSYIFGSIGLYTLAKRKGYDNPWLAWIPVANTYLAAQVGFNNTGAAWGYLAFSIFCIIVELPSEAFIIQVIGMIIGFNIFRRYSTKYVLLTVINVLTFGFAYPFILFAIRKNVEISK